MKAGVVSSRQCRQELRRPGAGIAAIDREPVIYFKRVARRDCCQQTLSAHTQKIVVVLNPIQPIPVRDHILAHQDLACEPLSGGGTIRRPRLL